MALNKDPLQQLAEHAEAAVAEQQARSEEMVAKSEASRPRQRFKRALLGVLLVACVASLALQWRALHEPYAVPQPGESAEVAENDLRAIALFVDAFRLSQGRLPENLNEVRLPDGLAELVRDHGVQYERTAAGYTVQWRLPSGQVVLDGATGQARINASSTP